MLSSETAIKYMEEELMRVKNQTKELSEQKDKLKQEQPISFEVVMQYAKYFLQHIDELILHQSNRLKQADFFDVIFDQTPTYAEIASVATEVPNIPGVNELFIIKKCQYPRWCAREDLNLHILYRTPAPQAGLSTDSSTRA